MLGKPCTGLLTSVGYACETEASRRRGVVYETIGLALAVLLRYYAPASQIDWATALPSVEW